MKDERFIIDCYGIIDTWRETNNGTCENDKLTWSELCDTLNRLNSLCSENLDEYKYITDLEWEVEYLKNELEKNRQFKEDLKHMIEKSLIYNCRGVCFFYVGKVFNNNPINSLHYH